MFEIINKLPEGAQYIVMTDDVVKLYTPSGGDNTLIHFTVGTYDEHDGNDYVYNIYECTAKDGMTWEDWVVSDYNTIGAYQDSADICISCMYNGTLYLGMWDEVIIDGNHYGC